MILHKQLLQKIGAKKMSKFHSIYLYILPLISVVLLACLPQLTYGHNWGGDFALYIHQAKSLLSGSQDALATTNAFMVENSSDHNFSPRLYPWGFPLLLAPVYAGFGLNYMAFKVVECLFLVGSLGVMFFLFKKRLSPWYALLFMAIIGFNTIYLQSSNQVLSELPFLFFSFWSLFLILKFLETPKISMGLGILTGVVLFFSFSIRTEGIGLFGALTVGQLYGFIRQRSLKKMLWKQALPYLTAAVLFAASQWVLPTGFTSHLGYKDLVSWGQIQENFQAYGHWLEADYFDVALIPYFFYGLLGFVLLGMLTRLKKDLVLVVYFLFLVGLFGVWPFHEIRYLYGIYPFLLYFFIQGLRFLALQWPQSHVIKWTGIFVLGLCLTTNITQTGTQTIKAIQTGRSMSTGPEMPASKEMFAYIKDHTQPEDIVAFFKPRVMHLYTNRRSLALFNSTDELINKAEYIVENKNVGNYFQLPLSHTPETLPNAMEEVFSNANFIIYKINRSQ